MLDQNSNSRTVMEGDRQNYTSPCRPVTHLLSHPIMASVTEVPPEMQESADSFCRAATPSLYARGKYCLPTS